MEETWRVMEVRLDELWDKYDINKSGSLAVSPMQKMISEAVFELVLYWRQMQKQGGMTAERTQKCTVNLTVRSPCVADCNMSRA